MNILVAMKPDSYLPPFFAVDLGSINSYTTGIRYLYCIDVKFLLQNVKYNYNIKLTISLLH